MTYNLPPVKLQTEYVSGWVHRAVTGLLEALPRFSNDVERDFGTRIYERMLTDSDVESATGSLIDSILSEGADLAPAVMKPEAGQDDTEHKRALAAMDVVKSALDDVNLEQLCEDVIDGMLYGWAVVEKTFAVKGDLWVVESALNKPRENLLLVVTPSNRLVGVSAVRLDARGQRAVTTGAIADTSQILSLEKLIVATWRPKAGDPRGRSILRPAYNPWYAKTTVWPALIQYLLRFGQPSVVGKTPPNAMGAVDLLRGDDTTTEAATPGAVMTEAIKTFFQNGSYLVVPAEADVSVIEAKGNGEAFREGLSILKSEIVQAILRQTRSTREAQHGSKADSETALTIQDRLVRRARRWVAGTLKRQLIDQIVRLNLGEPELPYAPTINLAGMAEVDFASQATAVSSLTSSGYLHHSQFQALDDRLGLPPRDMDLIAQELAIESERLDDAARERSRLFNPGPDEDEDDDEEDGEE